ncbi:hypothetical protein DFJ58DRAFT_723325 [Suillus subalutaceus]|uniref:uncharacterized protein n=1 Tax=Suillus subalutaceus TaxID=48586 RepID=UPI001B88409D|nr:uncharacterized protein DFJ58DRAFT_723325 [Suillus subalutaceus]KAG1869467.1 hypothetical protein DFJ58DRAFT_723325 [Suillus subalutaceus]
MIWCPSHTWEFHQACYRAAQEIKPGRGGADKEIIALVGNSGTLLYLAVFMGIIFTGLLLFPMYPSNKHDVENELPLFDHDSPHSRFLIGRDFESPGTQTSHLQLDKMSALNDLWGMLVRSSPNEAFLPYRPPASQSSENNIIFCLCSSGSTGFPSLISISNLTVIHWSLSPHILEHIDFPIPIRLLTPVAPIDSVSIYPPAFLQDPLATPYNFQLAKYLGLCDQDEIEHFSSCAQRPGVFASGPLAPKIEDALANAGVKLSLFTVLQNFGTSLASSEMKLSKYRGTGCDLDQTLRKGLDLYVPSQLLNTCSQTAPTHHVSAENLSDVQGYTFLDVFVKHPTVEGSIDDVLVLSSGEKTTRALIESTIAADIYANGTVMFGWGRNHLRILIEPRAGHEIDVDDEKRPAEFRIGVWIFEDMILVTRSVKPMLRARKGTVKLYPMRISYICQCAKMTFIGDRYEKVDGSTTAGSNVSLLTNWTTDDVESWLMVHAIAVNAANVADPFVLKALTVCLRHLSETASLISSGRLWIVTSRHQYRSSRKSFSNPSISRPASSIINAISSRNGPSAVDAKTDIENMIKKYSVGFGSSVRDDSIILIDGRRRDDHMVILTGSTGGFGSYLLSSLLQRGDVSAVHAFNCPSREVASNDQRQKIGFEGRGLDITLLHLEKPVYVETDTSHDDLGLDEQLYQKVCFHYQFD